MRKLEWCIKRPCEHLFIPIFPLNLETSTQTLQSLYDCNLSAAVVTGGTFISIQPSWLPVDPFSHLLSERPTWSTYKTQALPADAYTGEAETSTAFCYSKNNNKEKKKTESQPAVHHSLLDWSGAERELATAERLRRRISHARKDRHRFVVHSDSTLSKSEQVSSFNFQVIRINATLVWVISVHKKGGGEYIRKWRVCDHGVSFRAAADFSFVALPDWRANSGT